MLIKDNRVILNRDIIEKIGDIREEFIEGLDNGEIEVKKDFFKKIPLGVVKDNSVEKIEIEDVDSKKKNILIILESPHRYEYSINKSKNEITSKAPAQGITGRNIVENGYTLKDIVESLSGELQLDYEIILINPVPYQTSLYHLYKKIKKGKSKEEKDEIKELKKELKKKVWEGMWTHNYNNCKDEFVKDIKKISPIYIFNCCISEFKNKINDTLSKEFKYEDKIFEMPHPSTKEFYYSLKIMGIYFDKLKTKKKL